MENNLENKARFFALYWGQKVLKKDIEGLENFITEPDGFIRSPSEETYIELTPLSDITDEDAVKLGYGNPSHLKANLLHNIDELRGLGYAMPWMGLSVEKLIEYGWVKLKTSNK